MEEFLSFESMLLSWLYGRREMEKNGGFVGKSCVGRLGWGGFAEGREGKRKRSISRRDKM